MVMPSLFILFYLIKTNEGLVSNEILQILPEAARHTLPPENKTNTTSLNVFPERRSVEPVRFGNKSLLRIPFQDSNSSSFICYPGRDDQYRNVYTLSHITCRMKGFATFSSIKAKMSPLDRASVKSENFICSNLQQGLTSCKLLRIGNEDCRMVTEVTCGTCSGTIKGFKGTIQSPGFPFASFDDVTCEWNIIVPEHHGISLSFKSFDAMDVESADLPCKLQKPYTLIMYGVQSKVTVLRYCQLDEVRNLSIPFHSVKIIVFTGLHSRQRTRLARNELGISISYEATVPIEETYESPLKILSFFLLSVIFIACIILCHYMQKYKLCNCIVKDQKRRFLVHPMEQAYDLQNFQNRMPNENINSAPTSIQACLTLQQDLFQV